MHCNLRLPKPLGLEKEQKLNRFTPKSSEASGRTNTSERQNHMGTERYPSPAPKWLQRPEPGHPETSGLPTWVQGQKDLGHPPLLSQVHYQGSGLEVNSWDSTWCPQKMLASWWVRVTMQPITITIGQLQLFKCGRITTAK